MTISLKPNGNHDFSPQWEQGTMIKFKIQEIG